MGLFGGDGGHILHGGGQAGGDVGKRGGLARPCLWACGSGTGHVARIRVRRADVAAAVARPIDCGLRVAQLFLPQPGMEPAFLHALREEMGEASAIATFNEAVTNVSSSSMRLRDVGANTLVPATVAYNASARRANGQMAAQPSSEINPRRFIGLVHQHVRTLRDCIETFAAPVAFQPD